MKPFFGQGNNGSPQGKSRFGVVENNDSSFQEDLTITNRSELGYDMDKSGYKISTEKNKMLDGLRLVF